MHLLQGLTQSGSLAEPLENLELCHLFRGFIAPERRTVQVSWWCHPYLDSSFTGNSEETVQIGVLLIRLSF